MGEEGSQGEIQKTLYIGILLSHDKEQNPAIRGDTDGPGGRYAKWNMSEEEKYYMGPLISAIFFFFKSNS